MKNKKKIKSIHEKVKYIFFLSNILFFVSCQDSKTDSLKNKITALKGFRNVFLDDSDTINTSSWQKGERFFEITTTKKMNMGEGEKLINERKILIETVFDPKPSPYFAVITKKVICPKEYWPKVIETKNRERIQFTFLMDANERRSFGVCDNSTKYYKLIKVLIYCRGKKNFHEIDYYIPQKEYISNDYQSINGISCF